LQKEICAISVTLQEIFVSTSIKKVTRAWLFWGQKCSSFPSKM